jgi:virginiamycin B lyase
MAGRHRTIFRRIRSLLGATGALVLAAVLLVTPAPSEAAALAPKLQGVVGQSFPIYFQGDSVAVSPGGIPWFGTRTESGPASLARLKSGRLSTYPLRKKGGLGATYSLVFDPTGTLWFGIEEEGGSGGVREAIGRRASDGTMTRTALPKKEVVDSLTVGPEGDAWFTSRRGESPAVTRMTSTGTLTRFPLEAGTSPGSIVSGPDGAIWFAEKGADGTGQVGRITADGVVQQYSLATGVEPRELVAGPDGALWFSENGAPEAGGTTADRIGRITTAGEVAQFPIPFGGSTYALAADPGGRIWFTTAASELSSISTTGALGGRGCLEQCQRSIVDLVVTGDGSIWFAAGNAGCAGCGGSASLMAEDEGTEVGKIPAGALTPAPVAP